VKLSKILKPYWPFLAILLISALLRFWRLEQMTTFGGDQGYDFLIVKSILQGKFTLLGPKIGPYNNFGNLYLGPAYYYLIAPWLLLFNFDPIGPAFFTVLTALATILTIFITACKFLSKKAAVLSSAFYGFNALLIEQSRAASNPHLIPFFSAVAIYSYLKMTAGKSKSLIWPLLSGFSVGIAAQLHYLALSQLIIISIFLGISKKYKFLLLTTIGFVFALSGEILFEIRHNFFITNLVILQIHQGKIVSLGTIFKNLNSSVIMTNSIFFLLPVSIILVFFYKNFLQNKTLLFFLATVILGFLFVVIYPGSPQPQYFSPTYVSIILLLSAVFVRIFKISKNLFIKLAAALIISLYFLINIANYHLFRKNGYTMPEGWNMTGIKIASKAIANDVNDKKTFNVAATLDGDTRAMPYRYMLSVYGKNPLPVERYPESEVIYLVSRDSEEQIKKYTVWEIASFSPYNIIKLTDVQNGISVFKLTKTTQTR